MQEYFIWIIPFLLAIYSIKAFIRDSKKVKTPACASCGSTNINANMFKKYGSCKDCGHKWKILKFGLDGYGGGALDMKRLLLLTAIFLSAYGSSMKPNNTLSLNEKK